MGKERGKLIISTDQIKEEKHVHNNQQPTKTKKISKKQRKTINKQMKNTMKNDRQSNEHHENKGKAYRTISMMQNPSDTPPQSIEQSIEQLEKLAHVAICFPDSILQIPQTSALRAYFISQIARICSIFKVDQIIVLVDHGYTAKSQAFVPSSYIARNLQYLQTPQYLRKHLFKMHADLANVGLMNPIQSRHHLKMDQPCEFREGVAIDRPAKKGMGSWVQIGLKQMARMDQLILPGTRVTLRLSEWQDPEKNFYQAEAIGRKIPRIQKQLYWGYDVRIANNIKDMMADGKYNLKLLVNHSGECPSSLPSISAQSFQSLPLGSSSMLIFFSGTEDLSTLIEKDSRSKVNSSEAQAMFDYGLQLGGYGVKSLRIQQQMLIVLDKLVKYTY